MQAIYIKQEWLKTKNKDIKLYMKKWGKLRLLWFPLFFQFFL
jgi:hypothetical protein